MHSTIIASHVPFKFSELHYSDCFDYYESAHNGELYDILKEGSPLYARVDTDCREGLLYETAIVLQQFQFLKYTHNHINIEFVVDCIPSIESATYINYLYLLLNGQMKFTYDYTDITTFTCQLKQFNVPLYSFLLYFIKYNNIFHDLEYKDSVCQTDLYKLVDSILACANEDDLYVAFALWYHLETGSYKLFQCYDTTYGNSITGIAHHTEDIISRGSIISLYDKFLDKYQLNKTSNIAWINYLLKMHKNTNYDKYRLQRFEA